MNIWMKRGIAARFLWPLSLLFRLVVTIRRYAYWRGWLKSAQLPVPVIVVGNIFVGGTGKTPLVIWLVEILKKAGFHPGVISRGYGVSNNEPVEVSSLSESSKVGDEPLLIALKTQCPLVVCRKRVKAGEFLLRNHPEVDVVVSDDGMQHYALHRDVEIMLFDGRGGGNRWMLPAGPLREPLSRKADFTVVNGRNYPSPGNPIFVPDLHLMRLKNDVAEQLANRSCRLKLKYMQGKIAAAAGIGNPTRFFASLRATGLSFSEISLPDHFDYSSNPFRNVDADVILITEKDAVKCVQIEEFMKDKRLWVVPATVEIDNNALELRIVEKCRECKIA
ncbi:tetraacyldisaccharide 4'-kinase [Oxalobacter paraformigenes]|nr:tetraacyldisaccharide 4'-kinase [Oxalobacter paraformigenes]